MGRKATVTKEKILETGFDMIEESGYQSVNIKTLAAKVGCSTQPISWHFGNMGELRKELFRYCEDRMWGGIEERFDMNEPVSAFFETGKNFISIAAEHKNLFRFLYVDDPGSVLGGDKSLIDSLGDSRIISTMAKHYGRRQEEMRRVITDVVIYTFGVAMLLTWTHSGLTKDDAFAMIYNEGRERFKAMGIEIGEMK